MRRYKVLDCSGVQFLTPDSGALVGRVYSLLLEFLIRSRAQVSGAGE